MALSKIQAESMNLADTYAFSGAVSGVGAIGVGQTWTVVSRSANTTYTNSTGKTIAIYIEQNSSFVVDINGLGNEYAQGGVTLIIPHGNTWRSNGIQTCLELS